MKSYPLVDLLYVVMKYYNKTAKQVRAKSKKADIVQIRQVFMYIAYISLREYPIGRIGGIVLRSTDTTRNGISRIQDLLETDKQLKKDIEIITSRANLNTK